MTEVPTLGLIGGTGLNRLSQELETVAMETPFGLPSADIQVIRRQPVRVLFLARHGSPHRIPPHRVNYRANLWALREAGAQQVLAVSAVGGVCDPYSPGTLAAPDQLIDYTWGREHTFCDSDAVDLVHVDFTRPYEGRLRDTLLEASRRARVDVVDGACIGVFQGPRLETAAEIEQARRSGCHLAGMTSLPEASLARELGIDYAGLAVVSNWGAGIQPGPLSEEDIAETLHEPMERVRRVVDALVDLLAGGPGNDV